MLNPHFDFDALLLFHVMQDAKQILRRWIATGSEHSNEAFGIFAGQFGKRRITNRRIDIVAENAPAAIEVSINKACYSLFD